MLSSPASVDGESFRPAQPLRTNGGRGDRHEERHGLRRAEAGAHRCEIAQGGKIGGAIGIEPDHATTALDALV